MTTMELDTKRMEIFREILAIEDDNVLSNMITYIHNAKKPESAPAGFMTGDEFERRVKERVTKFYQENGLL
jgi:hypothetical protein